MTGFMPVIYPDELVYSWFCRYYVHSGYPNNKMALEDILYNRHNNPRNGTGNQKYVSNGYTGS